MSDITRSSITASGTTRYIMRDGKERVMTNEEAKVFLDNLKICIEEHPVVADWLVEIADRKDTADTPQTDCGWK